MFNRWMCTWKVWSHLSNVSFNFLNSRRGDQKIRTQYYDNDFHYIAIRKHVMLPPDLELHNLYIYRKKEKCHFLGDIFFCGDGQIKFLLKVRLLRSSFSSKQIGLFSSVQQQQHLKIFSSNQSKCSVCVGWKVLSGED